MLLLTAYLGFDKTVSDLAWLGSMHTDHNGSGGINPASRELTGMPIGAIGGNSREPLFRVFAANYVVGSHPY